MRVTCFFFATLFLVFASSSCASLHDEANWRPLLSSSAGGTCGGARGNSSSGTGVSSRLSRRERAVEAAKAGPECLMGTDGHQACGYHCQMGTDGVVACANTADGTCAMGTDGRVVCSQVAAAPGFAPAAAPPECHMGSRGENTCGYNCRFGSNGRWYCASTPDGVCAFNSNGTWTCS